MKELTICNYHTKNCKNHNTYKTPLCCASILTKILIDVTNILEQNNIDYFLIWGTLLGCIRHNGMIPWDRDADIGFLEKDYDKIKNLDFGDYKFIEKKWTKKHGFKIKISKINDIHLDLVCWKESKKKNIFYCKFDNFNSWKFYPYSKKKEDSWNGLYTISSEDIFPIKKIKYYKFDLNVPNKYKSCLFRWYGKDCLEYGYTKNENQKEKILIKGSEYEKPAKINLLLSKKLIDRNYIIHSWIRDRKIFKYKEYKHLLLSNQKKNILIISPYKTGTSTLNSHFTKKGDNCFISYYPFSNLAINRKQKVFLKFTNFDIKKMNKIILVIRDPIKSYISTFFQSINNNSYEYKQDSNDIDELYNKFISFPWTEYYHCNFKFHYQYIKYIFKNEELNIYDKNKPYNEYLNGKIIILPLTSIDNYFNITDNTNINKTELYKKFIDKYLKEIQNKYKYIYNDKIINMFI